MNKNKGGRKSIYDTEQLIIELHNYARENISGEITITKLVEVTNIPRHIWRYNKEVQQEIKRLNEATVFTEFINKDKFPEIISPEDILNANYGNKKRLLKILTDLFEGYQYYFAEARKAKEYKRKLDDAHNKIKELEYEKRKVKEEIEYYKNELNNALIDSISPLDSRETGVKPNLIQLTPIIANEDLLHPDLFDDIDIQNK
ncbi:MAG: hypothetical protein ABF633_14890 [Clostridium sp.]|uniref:hypothetical protein n=1 Tax=Clostridium sp. TaxID=1506 RepID=UPI0039EA0C0A